MDSVASAASVANQSSKKLVAAAAAVAVVGKRCWVASSRVVAAAAAVAEIAWLVVVIGMACCCRNVVASFVVDPPADCQSYAKSGNSVCVDLDFVVVAIAVAAAVVVVVAAGIVWAVVLCRVGSVWSAGKANSIGIDRYCCCCCWGCWRNCHVRCRWAGSVYSQWVALVGCVVAVFGLALPRWGFVVDRMVVVAIAPDAIVCDVARPSEYAAGRKVGGGIDCGMEWAEMKGHFFCYKF